jgi:hypothetical protein
MVKATKEIAINKVLVAEINNNNNKKLGNQG